jgi:hypothetical protein
VHRTPGARQDLAGLVTGSRLEEVQSVVAYLEDTQVGDDLLDACPTGQWQSAAPNSFRGREAGRISPG